MKTIVIIENKDNSLKLVGNEQIDFSSMKRIISKNVSDEVFEALKETGDLKYLSKGY